MPMQRQALAPELADDVVREILLRLTPDDPACLLRASVVCKRWRSILTDPEFRRRHRTLHPSPFVLGFLRIVRDAVPYASRFVSIDPASRDLPCWLALDCRHGRALFATPSPGSGAQVTLDFIVWDPLTNERRRLPQLSPPPTDRTRFNAAVLCDAAAEGCDHRGCHRDPFRVIFIFNTSASTSARVYSSRTDDWSERISIRHPRVLVDNKPWPSALLGDALRFRGLERYGFEYQLSAQRLSVISQPCSSLPAGIYISLVSADDGELCFVNFFLENSLCLCLWSRYTTYNGLPHFRVIDLEKHLPENALLPRFAGANVTGFAEGTDVIFVAVYRYANHRGDVYMIQLNSGRATKLFEGYSCIFPYTSFCIPVIDEASTAEEQQEGVSSA